MKPAPTDPHLVLSRLWEAFEGDIGWDVGANCGQNIPAFLDRFTEVIAFEPAEECWPYLEQFSGNITLLPIALSDTEEHIGLLELPGKISTGQLVTTTARTPPPAGHIRNVISHSTDWLITNNALPAPDFMKIDTAGHEYRILFGARRTLAIHRPDLLIEFHTRALHHRCTDLLEDFGYRVETVRHPHYASHTPLWYSHGWLRARQ